MAKKADLSGTTAYAKSAILYGCEKMFLTAATSFSACGSSGAAWDRLCTILAKVCRARAYMYLYEYQSTQLENSPTACGMMVGLSMTAESIFDEVLTTYRKALSAAMSENLTKLKSEAHEAYAKAMKENRIYVEAGRGAEE